MSSCTQPAPTQTSQELSDKYVIMSKSLTEVASLKSSVITEEQHFPWQAAPKRQLIPQRNYALDVWLSDVYVM